MVLRPETGRSVIHSAGRQAGGVEGIDRRAVGRREGDMRIGHHLVALADPKERLSVRAIASEFSSVAGQPFDADRFSSTAGRSDTRGEGADIG